MIPISRTIPRPSVMAFLTADAAFPRPYIYALSMNTAFFLRTTSWLSKAARTTSRIIRQVIIINRIIWGLIDLIISSDMMYFMNKFPNRQLPFPEDSNSMPAWNSDILEYTACVRTVMKLYYISSTIIESLEGLCSTGINSISP